MTDDADFLDETRAGYDAIAEAYAEEFRDQLERVPLARAMLAVFAERVREGGGGPVVEVGSGTGTITAYLSGLGVDVRGIDLSPGMVEVARRDHPGLNFTVGSMLDLDVPDASLAGLVSHYSVIHVPDEQLPAAFAEFGRVLAPGGWVLVAFQVGDEVRHRTEFSGHETSLHFHRRDPDAVAELMNRAGLTVGTRASRGPELDFETSDHAFLVGRRNPDAV